ncbi:flavin reductase family protein [Nocardia sp. NPDC055029]
MLSVAGQSEAERFKEAMSSFPSGATIVTTTDEDGRWWGFTASSFCSVSLTPPLALTCLAKTAQCYQVFERAEKWVIHFIHPGQNDLAYRFATKGADKFSDAGFESVDGLPVLPGASAILHCSAHAKPDGGDHLILLGHVDKTHVGDEIPSIYFRRSFHTLEVP